ncbi:hypothetical protein GCM10027321_11420 [Massilia terrae]
MPPFLFVRYDVYINVHSPGFAKIGVRTEDDMESDLNNPPPPRDADYYQLDRRLTVLETRFDTILPTLATKTDLVGLKFELKSAMFAYFITIILGLAGVIATVLLRH